jgi:uncharacterized protein
MLKINGKKLMNKVRLASTGWQRTKGLMFEDKKKFNYALVFEFPRESKLGCSIHMIFVFFPIDIIFLNKKKEVVDKVTLPPFQPNYTPKKPAKYVIEMPEGKNKKIKIGDKISW